MFNSGAKRLFPLNEISDSYSGRQVIILLFLFLFVIDVVSFGSSTLAGQTAPSSNQVSAQNSPLSFLHVSNAKILNQSNREIRLRGFHYECFYFLGKRIYDAAKSSGLQSAGCFIEFSKYYCTAKDLAEIKAIGANVIRIGLRLWHLEKAPFTYNQAAFQHLDNTIMGIAEQGLYVILDLHAAGQNSLNHNKEYGHILWNQTELQNRVVALWGVISERYQNNPAIAGYDLINEPMAPTKQALHSFYQRCIKEIRKHDRKHLLFIEKNLGKPEDINFGGEYDDSNIVLSVHFYKPAQFTRQGRKGSQLGQPYPGKYNRIYWDAGQIEKYFNRILSGLKIERPLFVGEFAANAWGGHEDALRWIEDVMAVFNRKGIHYTYFSYKFPLRGTRAFLIPREEIIKDIFKVLRQIRLGRLACDKVTTGQKQLFLSSNFESYPGLRQVLTKGFTYND
jgi:hypothetical protein